jgi:hypothetical protein
MINILPASLWNQRLETSEISVEARKFRVRVADEAIFRSQGRMRYSQSPRQEIGRLVNM